MKGRDGASIYAIALSPLVDGLIWCGTDDGLIWLSRDDGEHWAERHAAGAHALVEGRDPRGVALRRRRPPTPRSTGTVSTTSRPYIYRTRDGGKSWTLDREGDPRRQLRQRRPRGPGPPRASLRRHGDRRLRLVRRRRRLAAAAAEPARIARSATSTRGTAISSSPRTAGRSGCWTIFRPSGSSTSTVAGRDVFLFAPREAVRLHPAPFQGTPEPKDEPMGENPPRGAILDYVLEVRRAGPGDPRDPRRERRRSSGASRATRSRAGPISRASSSRRTGSPRPSPPPPRPECTASSGTFVTPSRRSWPAVAGILRAAAPARGPRPAGTPSV